MIDEWRDGYTLALELRHDMPATHAQLALAARWSSERLAGYLDGIAHMAQLRACTCRDCPIHADGDVARDPGAS